MKEYFYPIVPSNLNTRRIWKQSHYVRITESDSVYNLCIVNPDDHRDVLLWPMYRTFKNLNDAWLEANRMMGAFGFYVDSDAIDSLSRTDNIQ